MGEPVKIFPLDLVKIEEPHETDSVSNDFIKNKTSRECNLIKSECPPQFHSVGDACKVDVKSENPTTDAFFRVKVKQEAVIDNELDVSGYYENIVKEENPFEAHDDNTFTYGKTSKTFLDDSNCNATLENNVKSEYVSDVLTTETVKEEPCNVDKDIHNNTTSFDVSVSSDGPESQNKTGPGKYIQGFNAHNESGSLPEDDYKVEIDIADNCGESLVDLPDFSMDCEGSQKGYGTEQHLLYKPFSQVEVSGKPVTATFKNTFSHLAQQHNGKNVKEEEKAFECPICGKACYQSNLQNHIRTHTGGEPFVCPTCGKAFYRQSNLQSHIKTHTGEKPFECRTCGKTFSTKSSLQVHIRTHTGEKPFECQTCGKTFSAKSYLHVHLRTHTGEKPYECSICGKAFSHQASLQVHMRNHTGEKPFVCPTCGKAFCAKSHLQAHIRTHTGEKPYECPTCGKAYSYHSHLQDHIRTHTGEKPFHCPTCDKMFSRQSHLQRHIIRTHTGEKPFECPACDKTFSDHSRLQAHIRTHAGEKPYPCPTCGKGFFTQSHLQAHINIHTGEKLFACPLCDKSFSTQSNRQRHFKTHTGEKPFECTTCGKKFSHLLNLQYHISTHIVE